MLSSALIKLHGLGILIKFCPTAGHRRVIRDDPMPFDIFYEFLSNIISHPDTVGKPAAMYSDLPRDAPRSVWWVLSDLWSKPSNHSLEILSLYICRNRTDRSRPWYMCFWVKLRRVRLVFIYGSVGW